MAQAQVRAQADARQRRAEAASAAAASKSAGNESPADAARIETGKRREAAAATDAPAPSDPASAALPELPPDRPDGGLTTDLRTTLAAVADAAAGANEAGVEDTSGAAGVEGGSERAAGARSARAAPGNGQALPNGQIAHLEAAIPGAALSAATDTKVTSHPTDPSTAAAGQSGAIESEAAQTLAGPSVPATIRPDSKTLAPAEAATLTDAAGGLLSNDDPQLERTSERQSDGRNGADTGGAAHRSRLVTRGIEPRQPTAADAATRQPLPAEPPIDPAAAATNQAALAAAAAGSAPQPGSAAARATGQRSSGASAVAAGLRAADAADGRSTAGGDPLRSGTLPVSLDADALARAIGDRLRQASPERGADPQAPPTGSFAASLQAAGQAAGHPPPPAEPAPATSYPITVPFSDPRFGDALSERVTWLVREGLQTAELTLHPKELGPIKIELALDGEAASIGFSASQADTRAAIEQALPKLRDMLAGQGLQLGGALIDAGSGQKGNGDAPRARPGRGDAREPTGSAPAADGVAATASRAVPSGRVDVFA
jgi:flagellar hook-length control protein FliK